MAFNIFLNLLVATSISFQCVFSMKLSHPTICNDPRIIHKFSTIDYDWPNSTVREDAIKKEEYIPKNNIISGTKVYKNDVYVTVPRWRRGIPSTLNKVVMINGISVLQPFPNLEMQTIGDCHALQYVQSMEIDPNNGWMWIIDTGRINFFAADGTSAENLCPAKIVVYDINKGREVARHIFPNDVADTEKTFLNDIVVQYRDNIPRYAYISDTLGFRLIVFDRILNSSHFFSHPSMLPEPGNGNITILGENLPVSAGINGIALSADMRYIYYGPVSGYALYQIPTHVVWEPRSKQYFASFVRKVGEKPSQSAGMIYSKNNNLYFPALGENAIYKWNIDRDRRSQRTYYGGVNMENVAKFMKNDACMNFVDILTLDNYGYLWFTVNKLHKFLLTSMDFSGESGSNVMIWKVYVGESGYLDRRKIFRTPSYFNIFPNVLNKFLKAVFEYIYSRNNHEID